MGNKGSIPEADICIADFTHPLKPDWITKHANTLGLSLVVVERLWLRFQQLGANESGFIPAEAVDDLPAGNVFMKNTLNRMRSDDGSISFQAFLRHMKWLQASSTPLEDRIRATFQIIHRGAPVPYDIFGRILGRLYPSYSSEQIDSLRDKLTAKLDPQNSGVVTEEAFVNYVMTGLPRESVEQMIDFEIMPSHLDSKLAEILAQFSGEVPAMRSYRARPYTGPAKTTAQAKVVTDELLHQVAQRIVRRDWPMLANQLGFLDDDLKDYELQYPDDKVMRIYAMLTAWARSGKKNKATIDAFCKELRDANMNDIALEIQHDV